MQCILSTVCILLLARVLYSYYSSARVCIYDFSSYEPYK
jgi:hypothetical protein